MNPYRTSKPEMIPEYLIYFLKALFRIDDVIRVIAADPIFGENDIINVNAVVGGSNSYLMLFLI